MAKSYKTLIRLAFTLACVLGPLWIHASGKRIDFKVSTDSSYVEMGRLTSLHLQVIDKTDAPGIIVIPVDSFPHEIEFRGDSLPGLTLKEGNSNGKKVFEAEYILQSFDSGTYRLPQLIYINGQDTVLSNRVTLKVQPVDVSEMTDRDADEGVLNGGSKWFDFLPDWLIDYWLVILIGLIIIIVGVYLVVFLRNSKEIIVRKKPAPEPPYDVAMRALAHIKEEKLWDDGQEKQYYTTLTDILREYLDGRFGINAMEMTSSQIINALRHTGDATMSKELVAQVLEIADYVKFAKLIPLREDNLRSFEAALKFVQDTKPVDVTSEQPSDTRVITKQKETKGK